MLMLSQSVQLPPSIEVLSPTLSPLLCMHNTLSGSNALLRQSRVGNWQAARMARHLPAYCLPHVCGTGLFSCPCSRA